MTARNTHFPKNKTVALLGLTANPVTNGHLNLAKFIYEDFDYVWFLPCDRHNHNKQTVSSFHRLQMCIIALDNDPKMNVCDYEILNQGTSRTFDTICGLKEQYPDLDFSWVIGSDNADKIDSWYRWDELIDMVPFVVVDRPGYKLKGGWYEKKPHIILHTDWKHDISSTMVRGMLAEGNPLVANYVPKRVLEYIRENKLYE